MGQKTDNPRLRKKQQPQGLFEEDGQNQELDKSAPSEEGQSNDSVTSTAQSKRFKQTEKISFMEHNRLRNMAISLRKLSLPTDQLVNCVNRLDIDQLSLDCIEILMRMVPSPQEVKAYQEFESQGKPLSSLTEEDKFLFHMGKVERLEQKVKIMFYMKNLDVVPSTNSLSSSYSISSSNTDSGDLLASTKSKIECVESAAKLLKNSDGIRILLEYILVFGNYLNSSSRSLASAPAYGFKLQALDMVTEAKSTQDKSRNLLHFIVDTIIKDLSAKDKAKMNPINIDGKQQNSNTKRLPPLGAFDVDSVRMPYDLDALMIELEQAANVSLETLMIEVKEFERGIELCIKELHVRFAAAEVLEKTTHSQQDNHEHHSQGSATKQHSDDTIRRLQRFVKSRSCDIIEIKEAITRARKEFNECAQYFGENPLTIESSALFSLFLRHLKNFRQCQIDNKMAEKRKFDEELRKQIQQQQALRSKKKATASSPNRKGDQDHSPKESSMENLADSRLLPQDEVSHGTLDILITGLKVEPYRRVDGMRKSIRRLERQGGKLAI